MDSAESALLHGVGLRFEPLAGNRTVHPPVVHARAVRHADLGQIEEAICLGRLEIPGPCFLESVLPDDVVARLVAVPPRDGEVPDVVAAGMRAAVEPPGGGIDRGDGEQDSDCGHKRHQGHWTPDAGKARRDKQNRERKRRQKEEGLVRHKVAHEEDRVHGEHCRKRAPERRGGGRTLATTPACKRAYRRHCEAHRRECGVQREYLCRRGRDAHHLTAEFSHEKAPCCRRYPGTRRLLRGKQKDRQRADNPHAGEAGDFCHATAPLQHPPRHEGVHRKRKEGHIMHGKMQSVNQCKRDSAGKRPFRLPPDEQKQLKREEEKLQGMRLAYRSHPPCHVGETKRKPSEKRGPAASGVASHGGREEPNRHGHPQSGRRIGHEKPRLK